MRWMLSLLFVIAVSAQAAEKINPSSMENKEAASAAIATENSAPAEGMISTNAKKNDLKNEAEIPLNLEAKKSNSSEQGGLFRILFTLSLLGLVGTGAFLFLRKYTIPKDRKHQTQIKVLQQHYLGPKKSLAIVRVAGESILVGITDHNITLLKSLALLDDEVPEEAPQNFDNVLTKKTWASKADFIQTDESDHNEQLRASGKAPESDDEFAISGIKDIVSKRLKGMRSF